MFVLNVQKVQGSAVRARLQTLKCLKYYYVKNVNVNSLIMKKWYSTLLRLLIMGDVTIIIYN